MAPAHLDDRLATDEVRPTPHHHPLALVVDRPLHRCKQEVEVGEARRAVRVCEEDEAAAGVTYALAASAGTRRHDISGRDTSMRRQGGEVDGR
jgi:hypothetical protein